MPGERWATRMGLVLAMAGNAIGLGNFYAHTSEPLRYAGLTMCSIFIVGLLVLPFAPETRDQPLPE